MSAEKPIVDYTKFDGPKLLEVLSDDAYRWAEAFKMHADMIRDSGNDILDQGWLTTWFANAIEHSSDVRRWRRDRAEKGGAHIVVEPIK